MAIKLGPIAYRLGLFAAGEVEVVADTAEMAADPGQPAQGFRTFGGVTNIDFSACHRPVNFLSLWVLHIVSALIGFVGEPLRARKPLCFDRVDNFIDLTVEHDFDFG